MAMTPQDVAAMMQQILGTVLPTIMEQVTRSQTEAMQRMTDIANEAKKRDRGIHDSKAISKINTFKGQKDEDFTDWYYKVMSLMQCESEGTYKMMLECEKHSSPITHNIIKASSTYGEEGVKRDKLLYNFLVQNTEDTAAAIVRATDNCGSEAWRALCNRYDPKTAESRRKLMKRMSNMKQAKNLEELEGKIREMEKIVRKWEAASNKAMDEDLQVANITSICPNNMQSWLDMNTDDSDDYETVRKHIDRMIQKDIERTGPSPMDVSGVHEYQESPHVHAAGQDHGHGGHQDYDLGAVAPGTVCYNCGGAGHMASTCSTPKGAGKGGGKKGDGKGDYKGKGKGDYKGKGKGGWNQYQAPIGAGPYKGNDKGDGKGKGKGKPINGNCNACGAWGHMARDCWSTAGKGTGVSQVEQSEYFEPYSTDAIYSSEEYMMTLALDVSDYGSVKPKTGWRTIDNKVHQKYYEMFEGFMSIEEANTYDQSRSRQEKTKFGNTRTSTYNMFTALQETEALEMNSTVTTHNDMAEALEKNSTVTTPDDMAETLEKNSTVTNPIWTATALCSNLTGTSPGKLHGCSAEREDQRFFDFESLDEHYETTDILGLDVNNVEPKKKKKMKAIGKGRITIDSGAAESVMPVDMLKQVATIPSDASKQKTVYTSADGGQMWNHGHSYVHFRNPGEETIGMADFQRTTVKKPLASVRRIVEKGNRVTFDESGGFIENIKTGKKVNIIHNNGTYAIEVEYMVEDDESTKTDFTRQW